MSETSKSSAGNRGITMANQGIRAANRKPGWIGSLLGRGGPNNANRNLSEFYSAIAADHDNQYLAPKLRAETSQAMDSVIVALAGRDVLDVGCGTGYWAQEIAHAANTVLAVDLSPAMVQRARERNYACPTGIALDNAFTLEAVEDKYSAAFLGFFWRHIPKILIRSFFQTLHEHIGPGGVVAIMDSRPLSSAKQLRGDTPGDQYVRERIKGGAVYEMVHNTPTESELRSYVKDAAHDAQYASYGDVFVFTYTIRSEGNHE